MPWATVGESKDYWPGVLRMPWEVGHDVMPLMAFNAAKQAELNEIAEASAPPLKWRRYELCELPSRAYWEWHARRGKYPLEPGTPDRPTIPMWMRDTVIERDLGICGICRTPVGLEDPLHLDHIRPVSRGGETTLNNLQLAHAVCNMRKGNRIDI